MARKRMIHPEFFLSDDIAALSIPARLTFIGLWCHFDDDGRAKDSAAAVRASVWGMDETMTVQAVASHLTELEGVEALCRYDIEGQRYMHAPAWTKWQRVSHPADPRIPPCPVHGGRPVKADGRGKKANPPENSGDSPESSGESPRVSTQVVSSGSAVQVREGSEVPPADGDAVVGPTSTSSLRLVEQQDCKHQDHPLYCKLCERERWAS